MDSIILCMLFMGDTQSTRRRPSKLREIFAKNILLHRHKLGITQDEMADICEYHRTYIGSVERGERNITLATIESFAKAFKVEPYTLLVSADDD
jgi:transcriptional regulator with XRE-family HTH domain